MGSAFNVIQHNMMAMFTDRQLGITTNSKAKSTEKLSSGYKINRAADDAAGLSISEKMRKRIRGLNQGTENMQDGVSLCQIADGALAEVDDMLHRMTELSIKAANGTMSENDRHDVQKEINELMKEIDRVADSTNFNEFIHPLKGKSIDTVTIPGDKVTFDNIQLPGFENADSTMKKWPFNASDPAYTMRLQAVISGTDTALDGETYSLIYGDGSSNRSAVVMGGVDADGNAFLGKKISYESMTVDPDSFSVDTDSQTVSRTFLYTDPDVSGLSFKIHQSVTLDTDNKSYKINTSFENTGTAEVKDWMFLQYFDTAYGGTHDGDFEEQYFSNGTEIDTETVFKDGNSSVTTLSRINKVFGPDSELLRKYNEYMVNREGNAIASSPDMPDSISVANVKNPTLPFSEYIELKHTGNAFLAVGNYQTRGDNLDFIESMNTGSRDSLNEKDICFTYASFGNSTITYGIKDIFTDSNLSTNDVKLADHYVSCEKQDYVWIQSSDGLSDGMHIPLVDATIKGLGLSTMDVTTQDSATNSIDLTRDALFKVGEYRSNFGAHQNRLEHSILNNKNTAENTTAAESRIRDTDMADEMVKFSNYNILQQAGQAMLTQANQSRDYILSLLG